MPAALAIGLIGSAVTNLVGSKMASNASKNAAKTQVAAGDRAIQFQREGQDKALAAINQNYGRAAGLYDPYTAMGRNIMPSLTALAGSNYGRGGSPIYLPQPQQGQGGMGVAGTLQSMGATASPGAIGQGQTVMMRAPNGQTKQVPMNQVEHFRAKGAMILQ